MAKHMEDHDLDVITDIANRSLDNFFKGQMREDFEMLNRVLDAPTPKIVLIQHTIMITGMVDSMFAFLAELEDDFPDEIMRGLVLAVAESSTQSFYGTKKKQQEEEET